MEYLINKHLFLVEVFLGVLVFNLTIPFLLKKNIVKFVKWVRVGYFLFWALWAMVVFSGLIVFMFQKRALPFDVVFMIVISFILPILDGYRAIKLKRIWINSDFKDLGIKFSTIIVAIEIILVLITTFIAIKY